MSDENWKLKKELKRLSNYIKSYGQNRLQPIFLCIFEHFPCKRKSANWCTKMASDQKKSFSKMFLKFNFTAKYFWGRLIMCILHISRNLTEPYCMYILIVQEPIPSLPWLSFLVFPLYLGCNFCWLVSVYTIQHHSRPGQGGQVRFSESKNNVNKIIYLFGFLIMAYSQRWNLV